MLRKGAKIVLTNSWRIHLDANGKQTDEIGKELEYSFLHSGITLSDKTSEIDNDRAKEIKTWLELHPNVAGFVKIDDMKAG